MPPHRTFSHLDVIRIFEKHLDALEKQKVIEFFGGVGPAFGLSEAELQALRTTRNETLDSGGSIQSASELIGILSLAVSQLGTDYGVVQQEIIDKDIEDLENLRDDPAMPTIVRVFYEPIINQVINFLSLMRDILEPLTLLYNVSVALSDLATEVEQFRATVGIWGPRF